MRFILFITLFTGALQCAAQISIEGEWVTVPEKCYKCNHLCIIKDGNISIEELHWKTYKIKSDTLFIYENDGNVSEFKIQKLNKDSLIISSTIKEKTVPMVINDTTYYVPAVISLNKIPSPIKFIRRSLLFKNIDFDSAVYSEENVPFIYSAYGRIERKRVRLTSTGNVRYFHQLNDTINEAWLKLKPNSRKINFPDAEPDKHLNKMGNISNQDLSFFKDLLNSSNVQNLDIRNNFFMYDRAFHHVPSVLEIYKGGKLKYRHQSVEYPLTLAPVISFLENIEAKIK